MNPVTGKLDLVLPRWAPFVYEIAFQGIDLTGAAFAAAWRQVPDGSGAPLITLANAAPTIQGIALLSVSTETIDFGGDIGARTVPVSYVQLRINESTIGGLPFPSQRGQDLVLYWDMQITPSGGDKYRALEGYSPAHAGVTGSS